MPSVFAYEKIHRNLEKIGYIDQKIVIRLIAPYLPCGDRRLAHVQIFRKLLLRQPAFCAEFFQPFGKFAFHKNIVAKKHDSYIDKTRIVYYT